jgi:O-antigen/teichoic acid export membrane protein
MLEVVEVVDSNDAGAIFIRGGMFRLVSFGASLLLSIAAVPLVTRHLGPVGYGYFGTVSALVFIIAGFTEGGLTTLAIREYTDTPEQQRDQLLRNVIGLRVTATAAAVVLVAAITVLVGSPSEIPLGVLLAGAGLIVTIVAENFTIPLLVKLRVPTAALLDLLRQAVLAGTYVVLVVLGVGVLPFLGATIISGTVLFLATLAVIGGGLSRRPAFDLAAWRPLIVRTLPYAMATAVGVIYFREALVLIEYLSTTQEAGYYAAAFRIVEVLATLPWIVISASFPIFARAARSDLGRLRYGLQRLFEVSILMGVWVSLCVLVGAQFGIDVIAGKDFQPAVVVLQIQGFAVLTTFVVATFAFALLSLELYRPLLWSNAAAVAVATIVAVALIPSLGARGAAIAPSAAEVVLASCYAVFLARHDKRLRVSLRIVPKVVLAGAAAVIAAYAVATSPVVRLVILTGVYFAIALLVRAVPFELWNALLRRSPQSAQEPPQG